MAEENHLRAKSRVFNPPPGWPTPPRDWRPPPGWQPDPSWPSPPPDWQFWVPGPASQATSKISEPVEEKVDGDSDLDSTGRGPASSSARQPGAQATDVLESDEETSSTANAYERGASLSEASSVGIDVVDLDDERVLQEVGIYRYHHPLENAEAFKVRLRDIQERIKSMVRTGVAIEVSNMFTFDNSLAKGRKMTSDLSKLMLRAYNAEADNCIRALRVGNVVTAKKRLDASVDSIARLGAMMEMRISSAYHGLRVEELELTADYLMKVQEEKEAAREERARLREERKAERELQEERERLEKERNHLLNALAAVRESATEKERAELEAKVATLDDAIAQNDYRAANIRAGYVYVISNRGAFGRNMVKIGLTRRLEPQDRIRELGDASVPFPFDVHALFFSEDAVTLESELHNAFAERRVNLVNLRREFFFASPEEVRDVLITKVGNLLEYTEQPEATQYLQSRGHWPTAAEPRRSRT